MKNIEEVKKSQDFITAINSLAVKVLLGEMSKEEFDKHESNITNMLINDEDIWM